MKKFTAFIMAIVMALWVAGCSLAQDSSSGSDLSAQSQPQMLHSDEALLAEVEKNLGSEYLTYTEEDFVLYKGAGSAYIDDGSGTLAEYYFISNCKSGEYKTEVFCGRYPLMDKYVILRLDDSGITDAVRFAGREMSASFGQTEKVNITADEKLTAGKLYCQRTGVTLNFNFMEDTVSVSRHDVEDLGEYFDSLATSEDGMFTVYYRNRRGIDNLNPDLTCHLRNNSTGELIFLSDGEYFDAGFMNDGNIYIKNMDDYKVFDTEGKELFALSNHFPTGLVDENKDIWRKICGVYDDHIHGRYYVVYFDRGSADNLDYVTGTHLLYDTYRVAVLDENGARQKIIETGKYAETHKFTYSDVSIRFVNEHTISFYSERSNEMEFEVYVDLNTDEITLRDYRTWDQPME